jgi:hypothetical protein
MNITDYHASPVSILQDVESCIGIRPEVVRSENSAIVDCALSERAR